MRRRNSYRFFQEARSAVKLRPGSSLLLGDPGLDPARVKGGLVYAFHRDPWNFFAGVEILYGSSTGLQATGTGGPDDQFWTQDSPGVQDRSEAGDYFG